MLLLMAEGFPLLEMIEEQVAFKPECVVLTHSLRELEAIGEREGGLMRKKCGLAARIAREKCRIVEYREDLKNTDDAIIEYAVLNNAAVASNDKELRRRAREKGLSEVYLREESRRIVIEGLLEY
ncbi:30S processome protein Utp24 [Thermosphaera chiliense]|uniref:30S processome protein Utp24 n=2 Tax=Thermosphaera chiliense TaxID=3402707 RepID=A0A7M1UTG7_9CREN|nr:30S processome protein Utp24 [Thermosphaera aggregans]